MTSWTSDLGGLRGCLRAPMAQVSCTERTPWLQGPPNNLFSILSTRITQVQAPRLLRTPRRTCRLGTRNTAMACGAPGAHLWDPKAQGVAAEAWPDVITTPGVHL